MMFVIKKNASIVFVILVVLFQLSEFCCDREMNIVKGEVKFIRVDGLCRRSPDTAITMKHTDWKTEGNYTIINGTFEITRDVTDLSMRLIIDKCRTIENPDSCQNVYNITIRNLCNLLKIKTRLWTPVLTKISPEWKCPLRKGHYVLTEGRFDITPFLLLHVQGWYWKVQVEYTDRRGKVPFCLDLYFTMIPQNDD